MTGTAPEASFWLLRSEDEVSEHLVEQDYWAAAVELPTVWGWMCLILRWDTTLSMTNRRITDIAIWTDITP